ncbi:DUF4238 domain-containing protein [Jatrophihabitans cynanchi]|jgi:hypothetical protein|uniref:DUF4238 domain-containing protein n=1 Tax=Jatrophihabitans cynanchi TaxID=2944128 RepID=A0ABY7JXP5_9ACTN|nr:DUF4238 domain-containing protein [Jatrophihabitans sp. SB3-54]WAX57339.1 DUF4238 domain-containing protein [Jatrophihabitans sp. SB3-54]
MTGSITKNPHYVPRSYLSAWADEKDQVCLRRRDNPRAHPVNIKNVAVERGIYGRGQLGQRREDLFGELEGIWPQLRDEFVASGVAVGNARHQIALFAGLQIARTREHIAQVEFVLNLAESTTERPLTREAVRRYLAEQHLGFEPNEREVEGAWSLASVLVERNDLPTREDLFGTSLDIAVTKLAPCVEEMAWTLELSRRPILYTSDRPVMTWRPPSPRDAYEGVGLLGATEVRFPLTPRALLVMRPRGTAEHLQRVEPKRFGEVNRTTARQCFEFLVGTVFQSRRLSSITLYRRRPALRFNLGPGFQADASGTRHPMGDIIHTWVPSPGA